MTLRQVTLSNIRGLRRKYAAFLFSSVLSVLIFYLLASFVLHPDVVSGYVAQAKKVRQGLVVSQYIIVFFSFFFVLYSSSAFVRSRKKEFGLFSLLGATKGQLCRMVITEHTVIGVISAAVGLGLGVPLSKLMLDAMSRMLQVTSPVRFMVVVPAVTLTAILFMALFIVIGTVTSLQISPRRVVRLLREHQRPKTLPGYSRWIASFSLLCVGTGYAIAWKVDGNNIVGAMLPVTGIVSLGTYLFFAQASVGILRALQKKISFLYRHLNLLTVGDLVFRMKENARVLATVAVLSAAVITTTGTIYTAQATMLKDQERAYPHALTFTVRGDAGQSTLASDIRRIVGESKMTVQEEVILPGLLGSADGVGGALLVSEAAYNEWAESSGRARLPLDADKAAMLFPSEGTAAEHGTEIYHVEVACGGKAFSVEATSWPFPHVNYLNSVRRFLVIDDALFSRLAAAAPAEAETTIFSYEIGNWQRSPETGEHIRSLVDEDRLIEFSSRMESYMSRKQMTSLTAMIGMFVTALFFIASGSMLYFRLFSEIQEDREKYGMMGKLGVSWHEVHQVITRQVLVIFFAPILAGAVHCGFAMKALSNVLKGMDWPFLGVFRYALMAIAGFSLVQVLYFLAARRAYVREVSEGMRA